MTSSRKPSCRDVRHGFTLLELILVMLIVAILAMAFIPTLSNFRIARGNANTARQIIALSALARTQSVSQGKAYRLVLNESKGTYQLMAEDDSGAFGPAAGDYGQLYNVDQGVKMQVSLQQAANARMSISVNTQQDAVQGPLPVADPTVQAANTLMVNRRDLKDGTYVEFLPSGRTDAVRITLTDRLGSVLRVGCSTSTDQMHALAANEMQ